jgi:hypothetical protein
MLRAQLLVLLVYCAVVVIGVDQSWRRPRDQLDVDVIAVPVAALTVETGVEKSWSRLRE